MKLRYDDETEWSEDEDEPEEEALFAEMRKVINLYKCSNAYLLTLRDRT